MDSVKPFELANAVDTTTKPGTTGSNKMGKDEFLKLLMAQLSNQDPASPADTGAFVAQLAQFSSLEQTQNMNTNLENLLVAQASATQNSAINLVGKDVVFKTDQLTLDASGMATASAKLGAPAGVVTAVITDPNGKIVRTIDLGAHAAGTVDVTWDGRDDHGTPMQPGDYTITVNAVDANRQPVAVEQRGHAVVGGISFESGVPQLLIGSQKVKMSSVIEVNERKTP